MWSVASRLAEQQKPREWFLTVFASFYCNTPLTNLYQLGRTRAGGYGFDALGLGHRLTYNVIQSCIDTAAAKIGKNKTRVLFLTEKGNFSQQQRAKQLTQFCDGLFYLTDLYDLLQRAFVDCALFDCGAVHLFVENGRISAERVLPSELVVDENEAIDGAPRSLYRRKFVHRDVLAEMFPDQREAILSAPAGGAGGVQNVNSTGDQSEMVTVFEGWHLPSGPGAKDGRHRIEIDRHTLLDEPWTKDYFPIPLMRWGRRPTGFFGQGLAEQLVGIQLEITKLVKTIAQAQNLMSVPRVLVERGSEIVKSHVSNEVGALLSYTGTQPTFSTAPAMHPEVYQHLETLYRKAYEITGISSMSANGKKPDGLDAAVALREFHDIESERFVSVGQRFEAFALDCARIMIDLARDLYSGGKDIQVKAPSSKFIRSISWKDVKLDEDAYVMQAFPTSILPATPAGRLQKVQEMIQSQLISREMGMALLDFPDLDGATSLEVSSYRDTQRIIGRVLEDGEYESPEPYMNLQLARDMAQMAYLNARTEGTPEKRLDLLRRFIDDCDDMLKDPGNKAPLPAPPQAPGMPPGQPPQPGLPGMPGGGVPALPSQLDALPPMPA